MLRIVWQAQLPAFLAVLARRAHLSDCERGWLLGHVWQELQWLSLLNFLMFHKEKCWKWCWRRSLSERHHGLLWLKTHTPQQWYPCIGMRRKSKQTSNSETVGCKCQSRVWAGSFIQNTLLRSSQRGIQWLMLPLFHTLQSTHRKYNVNYMIFQVLRHKVILDSKLVNQNQWNKKD